jgi:hypothetical protein
MPTNATLTSRIAGLAENNQVISGVAVGVDDVSRGLSGDRKVWRADALRAAAPSLEGTPVNPLHSEQDVGEVVRAGFDPDRGVIYEAELEDGSLAEQAADGNLEVSIEARHADGGTVETDQGEAMLATNIQFTGLSLVQRGAAPSASAEAGEAAALSATAIHAALAEDAEMGYKKDETATMQDVPDAYIFDNPGEAVEKAQEMGLDGPGDEIVHTHGEGDETVFMPGETHDALMKMLREEGELMPDPEFSEGDLVRWSTSASPGTGRVAAVVTEPGESVSAEGADVTREATADEAAYKLDDYVGPEAGYDEGVVVKSASEILGPWDDAPEAAAMAAGPDDPETGEVADGATSETRTASEQSTTAHMSDDTTDELRARLSEKDDRIADLETQVEQLQAERDDVARAYAEALAAGDTVLDVDDYVDKFEVAELRTKYENTEAATLAETEPTVQSGGSEPDEEATLSESEEAEVADLRETIEALEGESSRLAEIQREQHADRIAELTGEDADAILATED